MAYAALSSLMNTLEQLLKSNQSLVCRSRTQQHVQSIHQNLSDLQLFLEVIEKRIRDVVHKAEDNVDSTLRSIILADCTENRERACKFFEEELLKVEEDVHSLWKEVMQIEFIKHASRSTELATPSLSSQDKSTIVGMEDEFNTILDCLTAQTEELTVNSTSSSTSAVITSAAPGIFNVGGSSSTSPANAGNTSSSVTPGNFSFGASSSASLTNTGSILNPFGSTSSTNSPSQPMFGNSAFAAFYGNNDNMEDSMAEDLVQAPAPTPAPAPAVSFGQPSVSPSPGGFAFGSASSPFLFGRQQSRSAPQNSSPFAASSSLGQAAPQSSTFATSNSLEFGGGGSFSLGSSRPDKSGRRIVKVNRNKHKRK